MENNRFPREISLCLSGGAAKGAYHLGVIDILEKNDIKIKAISGASIGAIVGASIASGQKAKEVLEVLKSKEFKKIFKLSITSSSIFKVDRDADVLNKLCKYYDFKNLEFPLNISVTDILKSKNLYYDKGNLREILLASSSIAPLLSAVEFDGTLMADGGITDNFPVEYLKNFSYPILGVNVYPNDEIKPTSLYGWIKKVLFITWQNKNMQKKNQCDFYLSNIKLKDIRAFGFKDLDEAFKLGQDDMLELLQNK